MKLVDDEIVMFAAMMFVAGANRTAGGDVADLSKVNREQFREAKDIAARELLVFKRNVKRNRKAS